MGTFEWLEKKTPRSVDQLRLWPENPRLNPEENHIYLSDYAEDFYEETTDFLDLIKSIAEDGFIPADPIVVWKNEENEKFYVAEGNRRVTALKLLRDPQKAPKKIRAAVKKLASKIDRDSIDKILVNVAPTFEDAEWYINQRNSNATLQRNWSRIQQQRWISDLYQKYDGKIEKIASITKMSKSELEEFIRILFIRNFINDELVKNSLTDDEFDKASSHRFPITILERFFSSTKVKEKWGIEFNGDKVKIKSNRSSFLKAFTILIKNIISDNPEVIINTRTLTSNLDEILEKLPEVSFEQDAAIDEEKEPEDTQEEEDGEDQEEGNRFQDLIGDPNRNKILIDLYEIDTDIYRLKGLFDEFKRIPSSRYINCIGASLRVFLDLAVHSYIEKEEIKNEIVVFYKSDFKDVTLKRRLEYLKQNNFTDEPQKIISRLLDPSQQYSLDVLNGFVHSQDTHYLTKNFINGFWDFLFPLIKELVVIKDKNV